jgi:PPM family protein phosphatase
MPDCEHPDTLLHHVYFSFSRLTRMPVHVELEFAARTDTGLVRACNEDAVALIPECGVAVLADGMGGYNAGEVASGIAVETVRDDLHRQLSGFDWSARTSRGRRLQGMLADAITHANAAILTAAQNDPRCSGMGTTIVVALFHHDKVVVAHVGDSRLYRWRDGELALLTRDHSLLQEQVDAGLITAEQARLSPDRNLITRAVGIERCVDVEVHEHGTCTEDIYLLCSDGLSDLLSAKEITEALSGTSDNFGAVCNDLVTRANANGGRDNISVVTIRISSNEAESERFVERVWKWIR